MTMEALPNPPTRRPKVAGKFIVVDDAPFFVKGVSYGAFRPDEKGCEYQDHDRIDRDFAMMAAHAINTVRIPHTMPPKSLLDTAQHYGLRVMVSLSAEQYVGYLIDTDRPEAPNIPALVCQKVRSVARHPALLCYVIGNEIPAATARWLGRRKVERYLKRIYHAIKTEDPEGIVTYANYPSTEYLQLPFLDMVSFNVYLEDPIRYRAYLLRLQNLTADRPLLMSEIGLDSCRHGESIQAESLAWQLREAFASGCAGAVVFAWTDEWYRAGFEVDDWAFGLTRRHREPKVALDTVRQVYTTAPLLPAPDWPRISVVICSHNGAYTIGAALKQVQCLSYPDFDVIVVDDGSTDRTPLIASEFDCRVITISHAGLSHARNVGWQAATGDIIAYLDDDAMPTRHWLQFLAHAFTHSGHAAIGGPNLQPLGVGGVADCVDNAPGAPVHVLLTDEIAEHVPGCNLAVRRHCLEAIGGFDPIFQVAGDDVDVCWRLQHQGWTLGFSHGAMVWHHRRRRIKSYWQQQVGYGRAEALLAAKWPDKYDSGRHPTFCGRLYGKGVAHALFRRQHVYYGFGGFAPFQSVYELTPGTWASLPLMPEWYCILLAFSVCSLLGLLWPPMYLALVFLVLGVTMTLSHAVVASLEADFTTPPVSRWHALQLRVLTAWLCLLQPVARFWGRHRLELYNFRRGRCEGRFRWPRPQSAARWSPVSIAPEHHYQRLNRTLREQGALVRRGKEFDRWDFEIEGGLFGGARLLLSIEDHGAGTQYVRMRTWPHGYLVSWSLALLALLLLLAAVASNTIMALAMGVVLLLTTGLITLVQSGRAIGLVLEAFAACAAESMPSTARDTQAGCGDISSELTQS